MPKRKKKFIPKPPGNILTHASLLCHCYAPIPLDISTHLHCIKLLKELGRILLLLISILGNSLWKWKTTSRVWNIFWLSSASKTWWKLFQPDQAPNPSWHKRIIYCQSDTNILQNRLILWILFFSLKILIQYNLSLKMADLIWIISIAY